MVLERTYSDLLHLPLTHPCNTIVVIGGGPVGLWVALQMKLLAREWDVHVFEKRESYARSHALRLLPLSFEGMMTKECGSMSALHDLVDQWVAAGSSPRTNDIERQLSAACEVAGVTIHRNQGSVTCADVKSRLAPPAARALSAVVCCDGVASVNRPLLMSAGQNEFAVDETFDGVGLLQVKFQAQGRVEKARGLWAQFVQNWPASELVFTILPGNYDTSSGTTPVTVFAMLTDQDISSELEHLMTGVESFKGMSLDELHAQSSTPHTQQLVRDIAAVLRPMFVSDLLHDTAHPLRISRLPVRVSVAARVVGQVEGVPVFLAGDAAMGLPLQKGLSYGWHIATALANSLRFSASVSEAQEEYALAFSVASVAAQRHVERDYLAYMSLTQQAGMLRSVLKTVSSGVAGVQQVAKKAASKIASKSATAVSKSASFF